MRLLIPIESFDNFKEAKEFSASDVTPELVRAVKKLDEREELEPFLRSILADFGQTPHGPARSARGAQASAAHISTGINKRRAGNYGFISRIR